MRRLLQPGRAGLAAALLAACVGSQAQQPAAAQACSAPAGELTMPSGVEPFRLKALDEARLIKVYVDVLRFADTGQGKSPFPPEMAARTEFSKDGLTRLLADTVLGARRFEVFDMRSSVTAEQTDLVIDAQVLEATQTWRPIEGGRKRAQVRITLSLQLKNVFTGQNLFPAAVKVDGLTGRGSGDGAVIALGEDENSPAVQRQLAADYTNALRRAFHEASLRIATVARPMAKVLLVEGCDVALFGGSRFGLQARDELVVFRARMVRMGDKEGLTTRPVAQVRCASTGTDNAQCTLTALVKGYQPQPDDYAVLTDKSMLVPRQEH